MTNPIYAADHVNRLAGNTKDQRVAMALTIMSATLVAAMLVKEIRGLLRQNDHQDWDRTPPRWHDHGKGYQGRD